MGVKSVMVEIFEHIHRSNLVGMGVLPLEFPDRVNRKSLNLDGSEAFSATGLDGKISPGMTVPLTIRRANGDTDTVPRVSHIDTDEEIEYFRSGGILQYVIQRLMANG